MRNKRVCDYIAEAIQNEILSGRMSSGVPLRQEELADSLGYSRIPIREALQILESQGLAKRLATRHVVVADFSDEVITEIYELLADVEIKLLKGMMQSNCVLGASAINENMSAELQFHETIISNSHNEYFTHILENGLWCYIRFAVEETAAGRENARRLELLSKIAEAYSDKDIKIVRELLGEYFGSLCEAVIAERAESSR
uniref:GntR family transcriptional regulator n=1 Tax=Agathobacter rectalis TaxID=39491 RepID=UPI002805562E|nr:GntR family transcriptional regulator [uncultured Agathobacter sp.]